jgi:uncharacterized damage-inducible protein DinB
MKISHAFTIALAFPLGLAAQTPTAPPAGPPVDPITTVFRNRTMALQRNLAQAFDSIPASKFNYKPTAAQLTIGYIAQHLANDNYLFCGAFGAMKPNRPAADTSTPDSVKATWPRETLNAKLKESFKFCEDAFAQLNDANLTEQVTINPPGGAPRTLVRVSMVLGHVIDMADHYSQIANYMRLNNIIPPTALPRPPRT